MSIRNLQIPSEVQSSLGIAEIIDITDQLPVNPNYTWAQLAGVRDINDLTTIGIHHDAWPKKNRANVPDIDFAREIAFDHIKYKGNEDKGDAGFPYHIWIRNGRIYQCNDILDRTYGIGGHNGYIVHICVSGDYYSYDTLTDPDRNALYAAILSVKSVLPNYKGIVGHCELNPKNCPGFDHNRVKTDVSTLEMKLKQTDTWQAKLGKIGDIVNEINYMNDLIKKGPNDGEAQWSMNKQLELYDLMKQTGLL